MFCFNIRGNKHTYCCTCCGNKIEKKDIHNLQLKRSGENYRRCSSCGENIVENAGKYPQIVVAVVGSKKCDTKGFITSAIYKMRKFDNNLLIELVSESSSLKLGETRLCLDGDEILDVGVWNYDKIEKAYKLFFENEHIQYPMFESEDSYDRAYIQSYTFEIKNKRNKKNALLTIVEINERFLYGYRHFNQMNMMQDVLPDIKRILGNSGYAFFLLDTDDAKDPNLIDSMTSLRSFVGKDALHAIICHNRPESMCMSRDRLEVKTMESLLKANRRLVNDKICLSKEDEPKLEHRRKCIYFMCSQEEHTDNKGGVNSLNCELPFLWVLILEGIMNVWDNEENGNWEVNRDSLRPDYWKHIENRLYLRD